jgi:UDP-2-acetamido-3-amino-2,3-dideoxy-glucuronate N-acetyltransferase
MEANIHPTADVSPKAKIGKNTRIWHQAQIREGVVIGENCIIGKNVYIDFDVKIGSYVKLQNNVCVYHGVTIEDDVFVGPAVIFTNDLYPRARIWNAERVGKTLIKKGASIGANSTIVCGHTIGENAMIGAGSVVTKDIPPHALAFGNPAKQHAWVCACGAKLEKKGKSHYCPQCKKEVKIK